MLPLEGSKEGKKKGVKKLVFAKFKVKITKGHYEASTVDDLRRPGLSPALFFRLFSLLTFHNFTSNATGQPFLFTSHSAHPLPLERCKVNISIGLQWPVSAALIPTLLFEGSIVPDLLAWFACLWIMAEEPQSGLLPSTHCSLSWVWSLKHIWITVIYPYGMEPLILGHIPCGVGCTDTVMQTIPRPSAQHRLRYSIPVYTKHMGVNSPGTPHWCLNGGR